MPTPLSGFEDLTGPEWEDLCLKVLHEHHGGGELVEVPDEDRGDAGIEAFSMDGCAYQCYAPQREPLPAGTRFSKQRTKIRTDVQKFIDNKDKLGDMIPDGLLIRRWILLVPRITTRQLHVVAKTLTAEVRAAGLPYAAEDIVVGAHTLRAYGAATQAVVSRQLSKLHLAPVEEVDFSGIEDPQIETIKDKLRRTSAFSVDGRRDVFVDRLLRNFVAGQTHRDFVSDQYSELGDELDEQLRDLEDRLAVQYPLAETDPDKMLSTILAHTEETVSAVLNTKDVHSRVIAEGQVAEWLMRCPLDFP